MFILSWVRKLHRTACLWISSPQACTAIRLRPRPWLLSLLSSHFSSRESFLVLVPSSSGLIWFSFVLLLSIVWLFRPNSFLRMSSYHAIQYADLVEQVIILVSHNFLLCQSCLRGPRIVILEISNDLMSRIGDPQMDGITFTCLNSSPFTVIFWKYSIFPNVEIDDDANITSLNKSSNHTKQNDWNTKLLIIIAVKDRRYTNSVAFEFWKIWMVSMTIIVMW